MFLGTHSPRLDTKGRLILPAKFRDELAGGVVLTRGQEHCLYAFTSAEFERMYAQLREAPLAQKQARDYVRVMLSGADSQIPDKQGRITLPAPLRLRRPRTGPGGHRCRRPRRDLGRRGLADVLDSAGAGVRRHGGGDHPGLLLTLAPQRMPPAEEPTTAYRR